MVEDTDKLMRRLGKKELTVELRDPISDLPESLAGYDLQLAEDGSAIIYTYDTHQDRTGITGLLADMAQAGLTMRDLSTRQDSLEQIFVGLVKEGGA